MDWLFWEVLFVNVPKHKTNRSAECFMKYMQSDFLPHGVVWAIKSAQKVSLLHAGGLLLCPCLNSVES